MDYFLLVIGSSPGGEKAAAAAAYFGKDVALIESSDFFGGATTQSTIPSQALREWVRLGAPTRSEHPSDLSDYLAFKQHVSAVNSERVRDNLINHGVKLIKGSAALEDAHHIRVSDGATEKLISAENILIAGGAKFFSPDQFPVDGKAFHTAETVMDLAQIPQSLAILGAGISGCEFATIYAALGCKVTLIDKRKTILRHYDQELVGVLMHSMEAAGVNIVLGHDLESVSQESGPGSPICLSLRGGLRLEAEMALSTIKRTSRFENYRLGNVGVKVKPSGLIYVNESFQTNIPSIYAVGDIIGQPSLANVSMEQGRAAVDAMLERDSVTNVSLFNLPQSIHTLPEISCVGITEDDADRQGLDYVCGRADYTQSTRAMLSKTKQGRLKLVVDRSSRTILGVHIIGEIAAELIHLGVELVRKQRQLHDVLQLHVNFPTLHHLYKDAAYDALSEIRQRKLKKPFQMGKDD